MKKSLLFMMLLLFSLRDVYAAAIIDTDGSYAVTALTVSGNNIIMGHFDGKIRILNPFTSKLIRELIGHKKPVTSISADFFGKYILSVSQDGSLIFWDASSGEIIKRISKPGMAFGACALAPSGKYALAAFSSSVYVWDTATWENVAIWEKINGITGIAVDESGKKTAISGKDGKISIYSLPSGDLIKTLKAGSGVVSSVAFAPDSGLLISGGYDKTARVWDTEKGIVIKEFSGHADTVRAVAAAAGGKKFATAGEDGAVILWSITGDAFSFSPSGSLPAQALLLDPTMRFIAAGKGAPFHDDKHVTVWFPADRRQSRNIYVFSDALVVLSPFGYVDGAGSFMGYVSVYENGRRIALSNVAAKYNRPERLKIPMSKGYLPKSILPAKIK